MALLPPTGKWRGTVDVAVKQLRQERFEGQNSAGFSKAKEEFFIESNILRILHHPHLVQVRQCLQFATFDRP